MTALAPLPEPDSEPDAESDSEPELSRVTVVIGDLQLDVGLPADETIATLADDVVELAAAQVVAGLELPDAQLLPTPGRWTLARLGAEPLDPHRSLAEFNVCDGEMLVVREAATPCAPLLFDDLEFDDAAPASHPPHGLTRQAPMIMCFTLGLIASVTAALMVARQPPTVPAIAAALAVGLAGAIGACVLGQATATSQASPWLAAVAIPLLFAGSLRLVPDASEINSLPMAFGMSGFVAVMGLLTSGRGRPFYTAVIALAGFGTATTVSVLLWLPTPRTLGAMLATAAVVVVYLAPRVTILVSKLPVPPVPTAGEPLDDIETAGGTAVEGVNAVGKQIVPTEEGMIERVRPSNQYLTGIVVGATVTAVIGSYLAIDVSNGLFWQGTAFAITVATVLSLRGRSHYDFVQSATLIGGGLLTGLALIVKTAAYLQDWRVNAAVALVVLMALAVACGVIAPQLEFSPVMKRQVEMLECVAIATLFPLCFWIIRLYAFFRELRL
jgi:type VII secretion integral membrane protein EccD